MLRTLDRLMASQWLAEDALRHHQLEGLTRIIGYALENVEYYRNLFHAIGLKDAREISSFEDLKRIPRLTKQVVRDNLDRLTGGREGLLENQTGGSTGVPLRFYATREYQFEHKIAANYRVYCNAGFRLGDPLALIWGFDDDLKTGGLRAKLINRFVYHEYTLNSFSLSEERIMALLTVLRKRKPLYIRGYANSLAEVSRYMVLKGKHLGYKPRAVFSEAERLDDDLRMLVENAFGARVYDVYGSREFGTIASECEFHEGLHVNTDQLVVEVAEENALLMTSFMSLGTVFIRYEIGDCAEGFNMEPCPCGLKSPRLTRIIGRTGDNFITRDGRRIHGEYVTHLFYKTKAVDQFQVVQHDLDAFTVRVKSQEPSLAVQEAQVIVRDLEQRFQYPLRVSIEVVDSIQQTRTGKYRFTICDVKQN